VEFISLFLAYMLIYGLIAVLLRSTFPIGLGLFFFFTRDDLIERVLRKTGVQVVPGSFGWEFIKTFVFFTGWWVLFSYWRDFLPQWLQWLSFSPDTSWPFVGAMALACAVLTTVATLATRKLLPRIGIASAPGSLAWSTSEFVIGLCLLGVPLGLGYLLLAGP
jgi:hypothetical protein